MNWTQLLSGKRFGMEEYHERKHERTDFKRHLKAESFTKDDVADIIRLATYGVIRLTFIENKIKKTKAIR